MFCCLQALLALLLISAACIEGAGVGADNKNDDADDGGEEEPMAADTDASPPALIAHTEAEIDQAVDEAAQAQQLHHKRKKVVNALIAQAKPAQLANGDGDVSLTGAWAGDGGPWAEGCVAVV